MSTEIIRERPLINGWSGGKVLGWIKLASQKMLSRKKYLFFGAGGLAVLAVAAFYFWGGQLCVAWLDSIAAGGRKGAKSVWDPLCVRPNIRRRR